MEMQTGEVQCLRILQKINNGVELVAGNAEFVLIQACGDISVRMCVDVGIDSDGNPGPDALPGSESIYDLHLHYGLAVESLDSKVQGSIDFLVSLAHAGIHDSVRTESVLGGEHHLVAAHAVCAEAFRTDILHNTRLNIGLDGIMQTYPIFAGKLGGLVNRGPQQVHIVIPERRICISYLSEIGQSSHKSSWLISASRGFQNT